MIEIMPKLVWKCPADDKEFEDPQHKCRGCEHFFRFKEDVNLGNVVIACTIDETNSRKESK